MYPSNHLTNPLLTSHAILDNCSLTKNILLDFCIELIIRTNIIWHKIAN